MRYEVEFPKDVETIYWDYDIQPTKVVGVNAIYAIFEHDTRKTTKFVGHTTRRLDEWKDFEINEDKENGKLILNI